MAKYGYEYYSQLYMCRIIKKHIKLKNCESIIISIKLFSKKDLTETIFLTSLIYNDATINPIIKFICIPKWNYIFKLQPIHVQSAEREFFKNSMLPRYRKNYSLWL